MTSIMLVSFQVRMRASILARTVGVDEIARLTVVLSSHARRTLKGKGLAMDELCLFSTCITSLSAKNLYISLPANNTKATSLAFPPPPCIRTWMSGNCYSWRIRMFALNNNTATSSGTRRRDMAVEHVPLSM